jgi:hypothetical protein
MWVTDDSLEHARLSAMNIKLDQRFWTFVVVALVIAIAVVIWYVATVKPVH